MKLYFYDDAHRQALTTALSGCAADVVVVSDTSAFHWTAGAAAPCKRWLSSLPSAYPAGLEIRAQSKDDALRLLRFAMESARLLPGGARTGGSSCPARATLPQ